MISAEVLHATAEQEVESLRRLGLRQPIALIPNGLVIPESMWTKKATPSKDRPRKKLIHVGRIHPKKGIPNLLDAWAKIRPNDWELNIYGPDETNHCRELREKIQQLDIEKTTNLYGAVNEGDKWELMKAADCFILPSYSENFGNTVVEALAAGTPVIATTGTPWRELVEERCGWHVRPTVEGIEQALRTMLAISSTQLNEMGLRGQNLAYRKYRASETAKKTADLYFAMATRSAMPEWVYKSA